MSKFSASCATAKAAIDSLEKGSAAPTAINWQNVMALVVAILELIQHMAPPQPTQPPASTSTPADK